MYRNPPTQGKYQLQPVGNRASVIVTSRDISDAISTVGLAGRPVCLHSSLRSFGYVEGGTRTVIDGILDAGCTVLVPTFSSVFEVAPPIGQRIPRNGIDYDAYFASRPASDAVYSPGTEEINRYMGAVPKAVLAMEGRVRGSNPLNSFASVGPLAEDLIDGQTAMDVYAPLKRVSELGGAFVLMGTRLTSMTALHLAEEMAGRMLFRRWARSPEGDVIQIAVGSCSSGFNRLDAALSGIERQILVGNSRWRVFSAAPMLELASGAIRRDPMITHCGQASCPQCPDAVAGGPVVSPAGLGG